MTAKPSEPFRRNPAVLQRSVDGETVLYLPSSDEAVVLDVVGSAVWRQIDGPLGVDDLTDALAVLFGQPRERIEEDTAPLIAELLAGGWLIAG